MLSAGLYITIALIISVLYLILLLKNNNYRLLLPSSIHTIAWLIVTFLILMTIKGRIGKYDPTDVVWSYDYVAPFILFLIISSIIGFTIAHLLFYSKPINPMGSSLNYDSLSMFLKKTHWFLYICLIIGIAQFWYLFQIVGFKSFSDYRIAAIVTQRTGYGALAQRLSGHASILGGFYLGLLGCKHAHSGIKLKEFLFDAFMVASTNIAIGGRIWIISTALPYFIGYFWQLSSCSSKLNKKDLRRFVFILVIFLSLFSVIGTIRNKTEAHGVEKFLYMTDGSRMTNLVFSEFPKNSFKLEYGRSEFLSKWIGSPMLNKYYDSVENSPALRATVFSSMPPLYFDFGFFGGLFMWGVFCFFIEYFALKLKGNTSIIGAVVFIELSKMLFQAPVGQIFYMETPAFLWLMIFFIINKLSHSGK